MKSFGIKLVPFVIGASSFWLLGWYQAKFHAQEGDLVRTGFLITKKHYENPHSTPTARDTATHDILLVGDSHLDQTPSNRRFQNYLSTPVSAHSHWSYEAHTNLFTLGVTLAKVQQPKLVVFEVVERNLTHFAQQHLSQDSIAIPPIRTPQITAETRAFSHLGNGVRTAAGLLNIRHKWLKNDRCRVIQSQGNAPLHEHNHLLFTTDIWDFRKPPNEVTSIVDSLQKALTVRLHPFGINFIIYIIPDKATLYSDFFDSSNLHPSFLLENALPIKVYSPIQPMLAAVNEGVMEVYKYSDTHLGRSGAEIVGNHLQSVLDEQLKLAPNALQQP